MRDFSLLLKRLKLVLFSTYYERVSGSLVFYQKCYI